MKCSYKKYLPYMVVVIYSTTVYLLVRDEVDYFQVFFMAFLSFLFFLRFKYRKEDNYLYMILILMIFSILYTGVFRYTSFVYSILFICTFIYYKDAMYTGKIKISALIVLLKYIIYAYAIVQTIQFLSVSLGLPAFNYYGVSEYGYARYNSLSNEPSHTARICLILILAYMYLWQIKENANYTFNKVFHQDKWLWISYIYTLLMSTSAMAYLIIPFTFLFFLNYKTIIVSIPIFIIIIVLSIKYIDIPAFVRIKELLPALLSLDTEIIAKADLSGSARINPFLYYFEDFNLHSMKFILGFGNGYSGPMLMERVLGHETELTSGAGGVFPNLFYDYGLFVGMSFIIALIHFCFSKQFIMLILTWLLFISTGSFNCYYQWLFICLSYSCIYFRKTYCSNYISIDNINVNK